MTADDSTHTSSTFRRGVLAVLVVLNVGALVALLVVGGLRIADRVGAEPALQSDRDAVMEQAREFMTRLNTYGPDLLDEQQQMPDYREQIAELTTSKFGADFEESAPLAEATVAQAGVQRTTTVYSAGVAALDTDRASVLVAGEFTNSYPAAPTAGKAGRSSAEGSQDGSAKDGATEAPAPEDGAEGGAEDGAEDGAEEGAADRVASDPQPYRVVVTLVRSDGQWLVDAFEPVVGTDAEGEGQ